MTHLLDLRAEVADIALPPGEWPQLDENQRLRAQATWRGRMVNEHVSHRVFAALADQVDKAGLGHKRAAVEAMVEDELRHARLCGAVLEALGGQAVAPLPELPEVPEHGDCLPLEGLLRNLLSISCLSETVAVALLQAERQEADTAGVQFALHRILGDEVRHARLGWALLDELAPLPADLADRLGAYLAVAFAHLEDHELANLQLGREPADEERRIGVCDASESRAIFYQTVQDVIVPGLQQRGLPAAEAWARRRAA